MSNYFENIDDPGAIITAFPNELLFPESMRASVDKYSSAVEKFRELVLAANTSEQLLESIRTNEHNAVMRMSLLKMFRRCVSSVCDTETTKKIKAISTDTIVKSYGNTFKSIDKLKSEFQNISDPEFYTLCALLGEYDTRGLSGYQLTSAFFEWFLEGHGHEFQIEGPTGAGRDIELSKVFVDFEGDFPCDFIIRCKAKKEPLCIGFARYDSTRGGAQSDDRTGGNDNKVQKAREYGLAAKKDFRMLFLSDGPGLIHNDTWREAVKLDGLWDGRVRVTTLKTAKSRVTSRWLKGQ